MELISQSTNIGPYGLLALLVASMAVLMVPRRYALVPILAVCLFVTIGQQIVVASFNLSVLRIVLAVGIVRVVLRGEARLSKFEAMDAAVLAWALSRIVFFTLLWRTFGAFAMRLGHGLDLVGVYMYSRFVVRDTEDLRSTAGALCVLLVPLAAAMALERLTGQNMFAALGGVPNFSTLRLGAVRAQGPFRHPILAGMFGATMLPVLIGLWRPRAGSAANLKTTVGVISCLVIAFVSASSGALLSCGAVLIGIVAWRLRGRMRGVRAVCLIFLIAVDAVMKAPIWFLLARASELVGGNGWHRSMLINQAIVYFREWWLVGTRNTAHWMPYQLAVDPTKSDITNQYIAEGVNGGVVTLMIFVIVLVLAFAAVGHARRAGSTLADSEWLSWCLGISLFAHCVAFLSVSYFDQTFLIFAILLSFIACCKQALVEPTRALLRPEVHRMELGLATPGQ